MKITIYELLGLIKDGKAPKKIMFGEAEYEYYERIKGSFNYRNIDTNTYFSDDWFIESVLNDEVEIIEEDKKIEKLSHKDLAITINDNANYNDKILMNKINELIEEIEKLKESK